MKFYLVSDFREDYPSTVLENGIIYNDHPKKESILEIIDIINNLGYDCEYFGGIKELIDAINNHVIFDNTFFINLTDGMSQKYSRVQAPVLLDILNVPYSGSDVFGSALMNNKYYSKKALIKEDILMPKDTLVTQFIPLDEYAVKELGFPVIVKPNHEGSSVGISQNNVCNNMDEVKRIVEKLLPTYKEIIIEEMIIGMDLTDFVIGNPGDIRVNEAVISILHNKSSVAIYGAIEKVKKLRNLYLAENIVDKTIVQNSYENSEKIFTILHASDIARVDYRISKKDNKLYFLEINSAPRFSTNTEIGFICRKKKWSVEKIIRDYIEASLNRYHYSKGDLKN